MRRQRINPSCLSSCPIGQSSDTGKLPKVTVDVEGSTPNLYRPKRNQPCQLTAHSSFFLLILSSALSHPLSSYALFSILLCLLPHPPLPPTLSSITSFFILLCLFLIHFLPLVHSFPSSSFFSILTYLLLDPPLPRSLSSSASSSLLLCLLFFPLFLSSILPPPRSFSASFFILLCLRFSHPLFSSLSSSASSSFFLCFILSPRPPSLSSLSFVYHATFLILLCLLLHYPVPYSLSLSFPPPSPLPP